MGSRPEVDAPSNPSVFRGASHGRRKDLDNNAPVAAGSRNRKYTATELDRIRLASVHFEGHPSTSRIWEALESSKPAVLCCTSSGLELSRDGGRIRQYQVPEHIMFHNGGTMVYCNIAYGSFKVELEGEPDPEGIVWVKVRHPFPLQIPDLKKSSTSDVRFSAASIIVVCLPDVPLNKRGRFANHLVDSLKTCRTAHFLSHILIMGSSLDQGDHSFYKGLVSLAMADNGSSIKLLPTPRTQDLRFPFCISVMVDPKWSIKVKGPSPTTMAECNHSLGFFSVEFVFCKFCNIIMGNKEALAAHSDISAGNSHRRNYSIHMYRTVREKLISGLESHKLSIAPKDWYQGQSGDSGPVKYDSGEGVITVTVEKGQLKVVDLVLSNNDLKGKKIIIHSIEFLYDSPVVTLSDTYGITKPVDERSDNIKVGVRIQPGDTFTCQVVCAAENADVGTILMPLVVSYMMNESGPTKFVGREVVVEVVSEETSFLGPSSEYRPTSNWRWADNFHLYEIQMHHQKSGGARRAAVPLPENPIPNYLVSLLMHGMKQYPGIDSLTEKLLIKDLALLDGGLSRKSYVDLQRLLLFLEEFQLCMDIKSFDLLNAELTLVKNEFHLEVPGLAENRPSVLKGDTILVASEEGTVYHGVVKAILDTEVVLEMSEEFQNKFLPGIKFDIRFTFNRHSMKILHRALESVRECPEKLDILFPAPPSKVPTVVAPGPLTLFNRSINENQRQLQAVTNILFRSVPGVPYLIFGPPGTGKTSTLLEAIKQVWSLKKEAKLLVTAPSNEAVDLLATKLLENVPDAELLRIYALSRSDSVPSKLLKVSNVGRNINPLKREQVEPFRIVLVTLVSSGTLHSAGMQGYFTHVFVDEAGQALEAEVVSAIAGTLHPQGQLIMTGDPKQLQPIVRSKLALKCDFDQPLLKRLMDNFDIYKKNDKTGEFNNCFITKLLNNYRSHEKLLQLPSDLFYDGELVAAGSKLVTSSLENWTGLPTKKFPLIFHGMSGTDQREGKSPSYFNAAEAVKVIDYVENLLLAREGVAKRVTPAEIGVISPYKKQVSKIRALMESRFGGKKKPAGLPPNWKEVTVGSTEMFQGQERRVIIVSTVRSSPWLMKLDAKFKLGFLNNPKRFNVAITRAKALLIVIGNPDILMLDPIWCSLLQYAKENGGCTGSSFYLPSPDDGSPREVDRVKSMFDRMGLKENDSDESSEDEEGEERFECISAVEAQLGPPRTGLQE